MTRELEPRRGLDDLAHRGDAGAMTFDARQVARFRPAAVAVHDHCDVPRQPFEVDAVEQRLLDRARFSEFAQVDHLKRAMLSQTASARALSAERSQCRDSARVQPPRPLEPASAR